jgi:hypothetical protein
LLAVNGPDEVSGDKCAPNTEKEPHSGREAERKEREGEKKRDKPWGVKILNGGIAPKIDRLENWS